MKNENLRKPVWRLLGCMLGILFFSIGAGAQTPSAKVTGRIVVSPDDKPLQGASVMVRGRTQDRKSVV